MKVTFGGDNDQNGTCIARMKSTGNIIFVGVERQDNGLYEAAISPTQSRGVLLSKMDLETLWHRRLAHAGENTIRKTIPLVHGMNIKDVGTLPNCDSCQQGKSRRKHRTLRTDESQNSTNPLDLVHTDLVGPMKYDSVSGARYFIPLLDDASGLSIVRFIRKKIPCRGDSP